MVEEGFWVWGYGSGFRAMVLDLGLWFWVWDYGSGFRAMVSRNHLLIILPATPLVFFSHAPIAPSPPWFRVYGFRFRVDLWCRVYGLDLGLIYGLGFGVWGFGMKGRKRMA